jgi:hypothetical protein
VRSALQFVGLQSASMISVVELAVVVVCPPQGSGVITLKPLVSPALLTSLLLHTKRSSSLPGSGDAACLLALDAVDLHNHFRERSTCESNDQLQQ